MKASYKTISWVFGDQLNSNHSWFKDHDDSRLFIIAELPQETSYCNHHVQKVAAFFAAMKNFAESLQESGHEVLHLTLDETIEFKDFHELIPVSYTHLTLPTILLV